MPRVDVGLRPSPGARGEALGAAYPAEIARTIEVYERLFATLAGGPVDLERPGNEALEATALYTPVLAEEIEGIARGSGIPVERIAALNARTEILATCRAATASECSAIVALGGLDGPVAVQTWDWHEELAGSFHVRELVHHDGRVVRTLTEYGIVGKIGVSSAGLGVLFTLLRHADDGGPVGVPVHVVARRILDEAGSVDEALEIARAARVSASTAITVVTADRAASIELYPGGPAVVEPDERGLLVHTNHFLAAGPAARDVGPDTGPDSLVRFEHLRRELEGLADPAVGDVLEVMASHAEDGPVCCHPIPGAPFEERYATLATASLDVANGELTVSEGGPCAVRQPISTAGSRP